MAPAEPALDLASVTPVAESPHDNAGDHTAAWSRRHQDAGPARLVQSAGN
jgi:hypothetical protein